ncbi:BTB/POZ and MATH domain-containing protein 3-like [Papaver somniferum]|uniref:BTB/POZ and MATH domain-containing protein 3-like n=1 Tax=Papaver somniferum TaxID=3469 RepID=UPI000E6FBFC4|nr:BTB/POZ and MATH domain-containing protein 3-like [Papaver somniferum]
MTSREFTVGGYDWVVVFYPEGYSESCEEYISLFLGLVSPKKEVKALCELKLLDQTGNGIHGIRARSISPKTYNNDDSWGCMEYMKRSELETSSYLKDDCLSIHCTVEVVQARVEEDKHYVITIPPSDMIQNLQDLLESGIGFDVTFQVGNEFFRAHKLILAARSPVFRAMFFGSVGNPDMETVAIEEFDPFAFKAMLLFLYSDELPELHENSDSDSLSTSTILMQHLLAAADRFDLARLRLMCEEKLCEGITVNTVATTLGLAEQHQCLQLKTFCLNFVAKAKNLEEFMKSDGFAYLENSCPSSLVDLLKTSVVVDKNIKLVSPKEVKALYEFKLLDQTGKGIHSPGGSSKSSKTFNKKGCLWGRRPYMKITEFEASSYLKDDCLSIHCTIEIVQVHAVIPVPPSDMVQNLKGLLESELGSDVTFQVGNEFFRAHKSILAARSPVFRAMFFGLVGNPDMDIVAMIRFPLR